MRILWHGVNAEEEPPAIPLLTYTHTWHADLNIQSNQADFDGSGDGLTFPHDSAFNFAGDNLTVEFLLNFDAFPQTYPVLFSKWGSAGNREVQIMYRNDTNKLRFAYSIDGTAVDGVEVSWTPSLGTEYHIAFVRDGADFYFFVDGTQVGATQDVSTDVLNTSSQRQVIGAYDDPDDTFTSNGYFDGQINEMRISSIAR